jgi:hypothetical protein
MVAAIRVKGRLRMGPRALSLVGPCCGLPGEPMSQIMPRPWGDQESLHGMRRASRVNLQRALGKTRRFAKRTLMHIDTYHAVANRCGTPSYGSHGLWQDRPSSTPVRSTDRAYASVQHLHTSVCTGSCAVVMHSALSRCGADSHSPSEGGGC